MLPHRASSPHPDTYPRSNSRLKGEDLSETVLDATGPQLFVNPLHTQITLECHTVFLIEEDRLVGANLYANPASVAAGRAQENYAVLPLLDGSLRARFNTRG
jgi:hypothetical protein